MYNWFCINKLSINIDKTKFMIFKTKQRILCDSIIPILKFNGIVLERVSVFRYLGVHLDENLTWSAHVDHTATKISKVIGIMRRLKNTVPMHILKTIYSSLINPHLNYCILAWGFNLDRILKLQKKAVRIITNSHFLAHTDNLFHDLKILKIEDIFNLKQIVFYHKFINDQLPPTLANILSKQEPNRRSCHSHLFLKPPRLALRENAKQCIRHTIPDFINDFKNFKKDFIKNINLLSLLTLKQQFKSQKLENYAFECTDHNCYPCKSRFFNPFGFAEKLKFLHIFYYMINFKYLKPYLSTGFLIYLNINNYLNITQ